ncbi:MAG: glycosyltransferase family 2 protein [Thermodesulfobacteriota bacterium]|nr:MAG: glycosyltransferase family 2 protein [Thermodesulfobacteriota bacterium]
MAGKAPDISVVIVSYNTAGLLASCLESVLATEGVSYEITVVDNASKDGSPEVVRKRFPSIRLIVNKTNRGFGAANNQALPGCAGRYIVLLNPDTTVEPDSFRKMAEFMDGHPETGLAGPMVLNADGTRQDSVSLRYPGHRHGAADLGRLPGEIACVLGACQIARASLMRDLGGFDEDFFLYGEDQDLCLRVRKHGFEIGFIRDAVIMHHGGQSEIDTLPAELVRKKMRAEYLFYRKHYRAESIRRIRNAQRLHALWRILSIRMLLPVAADKTAALRKLERYRVVMEEAAG